jgi:hypothetical protein
VDGDPRLLFSDFDAMKPITMPAKCDSKACSQTTPRNVAIKGKRPRRAPANIRSIHNLIAGWTKIPQK